MAPLVLQHQMYMNCFNKLFRSAPLIHRTADTMLTSCSTRFFKSHPRTRNEAPEVEERVQICSFFNFDARGGCSRPRLGRFTAGKKIWYSSYRRLGGPQGRSGWVRKISPLPGMDPRTLQTVASRYIDSSSPASLLFSIPICILDARFFLGLLDPSRWGQQPVPKCW
jgi:hypothetical protein